MYQTRISKIISEIQSGISSLKRVMIKILFQSILFFLLILKPSFADIVKPNKNINPDEVVKIQLSALMKNDTPYMDRGIIQTWEFAHPNNRKMTGPLDRFKNMIKTDSYSMLLNHTEHEVIQVYKSGDVATFEVTILASSKKYFKFKWQVEKYNLEGSLKNCWLTTGVSQPMPMGSSI